VTRTNICDFQRLDIVLVFFMKSSYWLTSHSIYLNRSWIYFRNCLYFQVISPLSILAFSINILLDIFNNVVLKKCFLVEYILHAKQANLHVVRLHSIKLIWNRPKQTISVALYVFYHQLLLFQISYHFSKFCFEKFWI
jgi:hypothetical protein